jgi:hypothetical protein
MDFLPEGRPAHRPMLRGDFELCGFCIASRCTAARRLTIVIYGGGMGAALPVERPTGLGGPAAGLPTLNCGFGGLDRCARSAETV